MLPLTSLLCSVALAQPPDYIRPLTDSERNRIKDLVTRFTESPRGPYGGLQWFCNDGTVLEPKLSACVPHGGGLMYATLYPVAEELGSKYGIHMGTIFASLTAAPFFPNDYYRCRAYIVEAYLERALDGWVLHGAKNFRGFRQIEDESEYARRAVMEVTKNKDIIGKNRSMIVRMIRAMPYGKRSSAADEMRAKAAQIGDADPKGFGLLRFKIHSMPEPSDMAKVEAYGATQSGERAEWAKELMTIMQTYYTPAHRLERLKEIRQWLGAPKTKAAIDALLAVDTLNGPELVRAGAAVISAAEAALAPGATSRQGERNLLHLHAMAMVEELWVAITADLANRPMARGEALELLGLFVQSGTAMGWFSARERDVLVREIEKIKSGDPKAYGPAVRALGRALDWARARVNADIHVPLNRYAQIEPRARGVIDDLLRSSMLLPMTALLDRLGNDAEQTQGGGHRLIGVAGPAQAALRGENPGLAVGRLHIQLAGEDPSDLKREDIALLNELPPELPPVAGVITVGAASSLSHVALLARNLGIPHATINAELAQALTPQDGKTFFLGVTAGRRVALGDPSVLEPAIAKLVVAAKPVEQTKLHIDATKLDLNTTRILSLDEVSQADTAVRVGPKAGELGRLRRLFNDQVSDAAVIPFGAFVSHVDRPGPNGSLSPLARLRAAYNRGRTMEPAAAEPIVLSALAEFRGEIEELPFPEGFEKEVEAALQALGKPNTFGVFVRSDTNVEDLKDFTGAGLNLTVPNCVGKRSVLAAIRRVWASPYSERSYRWRQRLLEEPEHVYPSVILHRTVPSDLSGVMVTVDLETGLPGALTVSASEGVSAVVDGGAPETVVLEPTGNVRLLASPRTATRKSIPKPPAEGVKVIPAHGSDPLLREAELEALKTLAAAVKEKFPQTDTPWDIEFGFVGAKLYVMQIRPLRTSSAASTQPFLVAFDAEPKPERGPIDLAGTLAPLSR